MISPRVILKSILPFFIYSLGVTVKTSCEEFHQDRPPIHLELILNPALGEAPGKTNNPVASLPDLGFLGAAGLF